MRSKHELKSVFDNAPKPDLQKETEVLLERQRQHEEIRDRIVKGLAPNGKSLRRNAICPCNSGLKFKKCCLPKMKAAKDKTRKPTDILKGENDENHDRT